MDTSFVCIEGLNFSKPPSQPTQKLPYLNRLFQFCLVCFFPFVFFSGKLAIHFYLRNLLTKFLSSRKYKTFLRIHTKTDSVKRIKQPLWLRVITSSSTLRWVEKFLALLVDVKNMICFPYTAGYVLHIWTSYAYALTSCFKILMLCNVIINIGS